MSCDIDLISCDRFANQDHIIIIHNLSMYNCTHNDALWQLTSNILIRRSTVTHVTLIKYISHMTAGLLYN